MYFHCAQGKKKKDKISASDNSANNVTGIFLLSQVILLKHVSL
jgi:hypothetical protein